ncbi:hypothetical protein Q8F55_007576 [Vanrija albida]|uniref:Uncharacterized protein n=1 Tax=Vanrija albida TaxID=181172 RepID=A0ABR3PTX7_9TREE
MADDTYDWGGWLVTRSFSPFTLKRICHSHSHGDDGFPSPLPRHMAQASWRGAQHHYAPSFRSYAPVATAPPSHRVGSFVVDLWKLTLQAPTRLNNKYHIVLTAAFPSAQVDTVQSM